LNPADSSDSSMRGMLLSIDMLQVIHNNATGQDACMGNQRRHMVIHDQSSQYKSEAACGLSGCLHWTCYYSGEAQRAGVKHFRQL
jgi:hypothetical protein